MIEVCFTCRLGRDAELRHVKNGSLTMRRQPGCASWSSARMPGSWLPRLLKGWRRCSDGQPIKAGVSAGAQLVVTVGSNGYVTASPGAEGAKIPN
jgi:hypothetical protein